MTDFIRGKPQKRKSMFDGLSDQVDLAAPPKEGNDFLFPFKELIFFKGFHWPEPPFEDFPYFFKGRALYCFKLTRPLV